MSTLTVAIICGGPSSEHEVSCVSGGGVLKGLDKKSFTPILIGITKAGKWVALDENYPLAIKNKVMPTIEDNGTTVELAQGGLVINGTFVKIDCIFSILHGEFGEDGKVQQLFEDAHIPYVGSGVKASADAMDKALAKGLFSAAGLTVAPGIIVRSGDPHPDAQTLSYPVFVKPSSGGSSRGTHKVKSADTLSAAINDAFLYDSKILIETAINGREIECAVLEINGEVKASLVGQIKIDAKYEFYDFEAKYLDGATTIELPAPIDQKIADQIRAKAVEAFISLGCSGLARVDFFLTPNNEIIINELNTMPGFTATSVFPKMWAATGVTYSQTVTHLLQAALTRNNGVLGN
jgi:D-alanine-D-alanine ligase